MNSNGWNEWKNHVLIELNRLHDTQQENNLKLNQIHVSVEKLKTKAQVWGAIAGILATTISQIFITYLKKF